MTELTETAMARPRNAPTLDFRRWWMSQRVRQVREGIIHVLLFLTGIVSILTTIAIIISLFTEAIAFFLRPEVSLLTFLTGTTWRPLANDVQPENFGALPLFNGTILIALISGAIAIPLGTGSAVFLSEYARPALRSTLKPVLEILAGIPSVVYGYFALSFITPILRSGAEPYNALRDSVSGALLQFIFNLPPILQTAFRPETIAQLSEMYLDEFRVDFTNAGSAAIVMGIMILPLVASISEDAMRAVPQALREGAYGLGASRFEVAFRIVVPAALSGILAGYILAFSRAIGETMIVAIAAGNTPRMTANPFTSVQTVTGFIVQVSFGDTPVGSINNQSIFAVGAALFILTFLMNIISNFIVNRFREEYD